MPPAGLEACASAWASSEVVRASLLRETASTRPRNTNSAAGADEVSQGIVGHAYRCNSLGTRESPRELWGAAYFEASFLRPLEFMARLARALSLEAPGKLRRLQRSLEALQERHFQQNHVNSTSGHGGGGGGIFFMLRFGMCVPAACFFTGATNEPSLSPPNTAGLRYAAREVLGFHLGAWMESYARGDPMVDSNPIFAVEFASPPVVPTMTPQEKVVPAPRRAGLPPEPHPDPTTPLVIRRKDKTTSGSQPIKLVVRSGPVRRSALSKARSKGLATARVVGGRTPMATGPAAAADPQGCRREGAARSGGRGRGRRQGDEVRGGRGRGRRRRRRRRGGGGGRGRTCEGGIEQHFQPPPSRFSPRRGRRSTRMSGRRAPPLSSLQRHQLSSSAAAPVGTATTHTGRRHDTPRLSVPIPTDEELEVVPFSLDCFASSETLARVGGDRVGGFGNARHGFFTKVELIRECCCSAGSLGSSVCWHRKVIGHYFGVDEATLDDEDAQRGGLCRLQARVGLPVAFLLPRVGAGRTLPVGTKGQRRQRS